MDFHQKIAVFASGAGSNAQKIIEFLVVVKFLWL